MKNPIVRGILAVIGGWVAGSVVNMAIIMLSSSIISLPEGVVAGDMESMKANIHLFEGKHYIMPFLAHALGTLVGAWVAVKIGLSHQLVLAMIIGVLFLIGGIMASQMLGITGTPMWVDVLLAYIPFAYFGYQIGK